MSPDHPLYRFRYCPLCGAEGFQEHGANARRCPGCGFTYYANPKASTAAIIINEQDEILVARRAEEPARGTLDLVGGFMDLDETAEEGLCREIKEETGLLVLPEQTRFLFSQPNHYPFSGIIVRTIDLFFEVRVQGHPVAAAHDDVASLEWIPLSQLRIEDFGFESMRKALTRYCMAI